MKKKKEKKVRKPRTHRIMNRPVLALFLMPLWCMLIAGIFGYIVDGIISGCYPVYKGQLGSAAGGLLCLAIHKGWFDGEFDGNLTLRGTKKGLLLLSPCLIFVVLNLLEMATPAPADSGCHERTLMSGRSGSVQSISRNRYPRSP